MAVKMKSSPKVAEPTEAPTKSTAKGPKFKVMLGNKCMRYLTPDGRLFLQGKEYEVTAEERKEMFKLADELGVRYFYDAEFVKKREARMKQIERQKSAARDGRGEEDSGERILTDEEGNEIGEGGGDVVEV